MSRADFILERADRVARRFTLWKLNRDLRGWTPPVASSEPATEAERWTGPDGVLIVLEQDIDDMRGTVMLSLEGFRRLLAAAGYVRTDNLRPEDAQ